MRRLSQYSTRFRGSYNRFSFSSVLPSTQVESRVDGRNESVAVYAADSNMIRKTQELLRQHVDQHSPQTLQRIFDHWIDNPSIPDSAMELLAMHGASSEYVPPLLTKWLRHTKEKDSKLATRLASSFQHRTDSARLVLELKLFHSESYPSVINIIEAFRSCVPLPPTAEDYALLFQALVGRCPPEMKDAVDEEIKRSFVTMKSLGIRPNAACYAAGLKFYSGDETSAKTAEFDELWKDMVANQIEPDAQCYVGALLAALHDGKIRVAVEALKPIIQKEQEEVDSNFAATGCAAHTLLKHFRILIKEKNEQGSLVAAAENVANATVKIVPQRWRSLINGTLMDIYTVTKQHGKVQTMVKGGAVPSDVVSQSMLIKSWISAGKHENVVPHIQKHLKPALLRTAIVEWANQGETGWIHIQHLLKATGGKIPFDLWTYNTLLTAATKADPSVALERCNSIWKRLKADNKNTPDTVTYNLMLTAAYRSRRPDVAQATLRHFTPDIHTYSLLLKEATENGDLEEAEQILLEKMQRAGIQPNIYAYVILLHGWRRAKRPDRLLLLYDEMIRRSIEPTRESYKLVVHCLAEYELHLPRADEMLQSLEKRDIQPDRFMYISVFKGYCLFGNPDMATRVLIRQISVAKKDRTLLPPPSTIHALINAWIKKKDIARATDVLIRMQQLHENGILLQGPDIGTGNVLMRSWHNFDGVRQQEKERYMSSLHVILKKMAKVAHTSRASNTNAPEMKPTDTPALKSRSQREE